ncbi:MAG: hypothetical protein JST20_12100 [Bacteroidetes bacterium]|nr:hypothetical protein [Bacteroidota bacterium]
MKQHLLIMVVVGSMFLSSCATVLNDNFTSININTSDKSQIVLKTDTLQTDTLQTVDNFITLTVPRSEKPLNISIQSDSLKKVITIDPKYSFSYYLNLIYNCGIGLFIENHFPKSFTYPSNIYINTTTDTLNQYYQYYSPPKEGKLDFHISLPHINSFYLHPTDENYKQKTGFWGISLGVDYYHTSKQFVNLSMSALTDFFLPIP